MSSSSSVSSSSSSSQDFTSRNITVAIINQGHGDILSFSWINEGGTQADDGYNSTLGFTIEASNSAYFDYSAIINRDNSYLTASDAASDTYVPNSESSQYRHSNELYVDIIAKDSSGIKEIRTHVEPNKYDFEDANGAGQTFFIPIFRWGR